MAKIHGRVSRPCNASVVPGVPTRRQDRGEGTPKPAAGAASLTTWTGSGHRTWPTPERAVAAWRRRQLLVALTRGRARRARSSAVEHLTFNQVVVGSIPTGLTIDFKNLAVPRNRSP